MKKRESFFDSKLDEIYQVGEMLQQEGKSCAEHRAYIQVATLLLFISSSLRRIGYVLFALLGILLGKLLN